MFINIFDALKKCEIIAVSQRDSSKTFGLTSDYYNNALFKTRETRSVSMVWQRVAKRESTRDWYKLRSTGYPSCCDTVCQFFGMLHYWKIPIIACNVLLFYYRGRLLLRTPGPVHLGLAYILLVETNPFPNLSLFYRTMLFEYPSVLSRFCLLHYVDKPTPVY